MNTRKLPDGAQISYTTKAPKLIRLRPVPITAWVASIGFLPMTLGLIFILLYTMFGNVCDGLLMFIGVPFALTGVAVLNSLVMLAFIRGLREKGFSLDDAIQTGALTRLRPV